MAHEHCLNAITGSVIGFPSIMSGALKSYGRLLAGDHRTFQTSCLLILLTPLLMGPSRLWAAGRTLVLHDPDHVAAEIDELLELEFAAKGVVPAPLISDEDFLRRAYFDLAGTPPTPEDLATFLPSADPAKRAALIDRLVGSPEYAENFASYWKTVIYFNATDDRARIFQSSFKTWMTEQITKQRTWDAITKDLLTAMGDVRENGATALIFAHQGAAPELAGEVSRIFLGTQIQCANCHDHPTEKWKREQFHELAAYFARTRVVINRDDGPRSFEVIAMNEFRESFANAFFNNPALIIRMVDANGDRRISKSEAAKRPRLAEHFAELLEHCDKDMDGMLTAEELKDAPRPEGRFNGRAEYFMPDLNDPSSQGTMILPSMFTTETADLRFGASDEARRLMLAKAITSKDNLLYAKSYVNRLWSVYLGYGFVNPIDDLSELNTVHHPAAFDLLARAFIANNYNMQWLDRTITRTRAYQRQIRPIDESAEQVLFASAIPVRLRGEQIYNALAKVYGSDLLASARNAAMGGGMMMMARDPQDQFATLYSVDPSLPQDEIPLDIPQSLFMMNSPQVNKITNGSPNSPVTQLRNRFPNDDDFIREAYLLALSRQPTSTEMQIASVYLKNASHQGEACEDILWSLLNSTEFITRP